jgi:hypothetical protein
MAQAAPWLEPRREPSLTNTTIGALPDTTLPAKKLACLTPSRAGGSSMASTITSVPERWHPVKTLLRPARRGRAR